MSWSVGNNTMTRGWQEPSLISLGAVGQNSVSQHPRGHEGVWPPPGKEIPHICSVSFLPASSTFSPPSPPHDLVTRLQGRKPCPTHSRCSVNHGLDMLTKWNQNNSSFLLSKIMQKNDMWTSEIHFFLCLEGCFLCHTASAPRGLLYQLHVPSDDRQLW